MTLYLAFLRGINVGGHRVKMATLQGYFRDLGWSDASTFISSGNVIFTAPASTPAGLERRIESHLAAQLGYAVDTFVRTAAQVAATAAYEPWPDREPEATDSRYVVVLRRPLDASTAEAVLALAGDRDLLALEGAHLHWLSRGALLDSPLEGPVLGRTIGVSTTTRNLNTIRRLAAKYPPKPSRMGARHDQPAD